MFAQLQNQPGVSTLLSLAIAAFSFVSSQVVVLQQDQAEQAPRADAERQQASERAPRERQTAKTPDERADDETPALGVLTGSCPGKAVCVKGIVPDGPAAEAGIEPGDYILSLNGKEVTSPFALKKLIESMNADDEVTLKIWRAGEEMERKVRLASRADQLPKGHDTWLGVMLANDENGNVKIDHIVPGSPASESELMEEDILVKVRDKNVKDAQSFIETIEEMGPGDELQLTVRRENEELSIDVQLGSFSDAPMAFLRQLQPDYEMPIPSRLRGAPSSDPLIDRALDEMRRQIRELRDEVRELKSDNADEPANPADVKQGDVSDLFTPSGAKFVAQVQVQVPSRSRLNSRINPYRNYYYSPYNQRNSSYYGNNFVSPYSGNNYYYRYGGRPYYYGGDRSWYGNRPRAGIQVGPNLGVYWY